MFDKTFVKFVLVFVIIVAVSIALVVFAKVYGTGTNKLPQNLDILK